MKKTFLIFISIFSFMALAAQTPAQKALANDYLDKYASYAVEEMLRSGVPASITLAQGMLESNYGRSELAVKANNHFGIQSHNSWKGKSYEYMDSGELRSFRKYKNVLESYEDHSDFLLNNRRYADLFKLELTDYEGWAEGLKKAGYAEDEKYAEKLKRVVRMYDLQKYDLVTDLADLRGRRVKDKETAPEVPEDNVVMAVRDEEPLTEQQKRTYRYVLSREMYSQNGVPFIYAAAGETYADIARQYNLFLGEVLSFNDASQDGELHAGAVVYLQAKKRKAAKEYGTYVVEDGMSMLAISQKFAVRLKRLYKMNDLSEDHVPQAGETIKLR